MGKIDSLASITVVIEPADCGCFVEENCVDDQMDNVVVKLNLFGVERFFVCHEPRSNELKKVDTFCVKIRRLMSHLDCANIHRTYHDSW